MDIFEPVLVVQHPVVRSEVRIVFVNGDGGEFVRVVEKRSARKAADGRGNAGDGERREESLSLVVEYIRPAGADSLLDDSLVAYKLPPDLGVDGAAHDSADVLVLLQFDDVLVLGQGDRQKQSKDNCEGDYHKAHGAYRQDFVPETRRRVEFVGADAPLVQFGKSRVAVWRGDSQSLALFVFTCVV